jgi:hypothetical protein
MADPIFTVGAGILIATALRDGVKRIKKHGPCHAGSHRLRGKVRYTDGKGKRLDKYEQKCVDCRRWVQLVDLNDVSAEDLSECPGGKDYERKRAAAAAAAR